MDEKSIERGLTCSTKGVASGEIPHASKKLGKGRQRRWSSQLQHLEWWYHVFEDYTTTKSKWSKRKRINHCPRCWVVRWQAIFPKGYSQWARVAQFARWRWLWVGLVHALFSRHNIILMMWLWEKRRWEKMSVRLPFWVRPMIGLSWSRSKLCTINPFSWSPVVMPFAGST